MRTCVWFRRDLRIADQAALTAAATAAKVAQGSCIALYIASPGDWKRHDDAPVKIDYTLRSLAILSKDLEKLGIPLLFRIAKTPSDIAKVLQDVVTQNTITQVHAGIEYELHEQSRDRAASALLTKLGCRISWHNTQLIVEPGQVLTKTQTYYTVYTPFRKAWTKLVEEPGTGPDLLQTAATPPKLSLESAGVKADPIPTAAELGFASPINPDLWPAGEHAAVKRLTQFCEKAIYKYKTERDIPAIDGTSKLSHALAVGTISPRMCVNAARAANDGRISAGNDGCVHWISEVIWREFYRQLIVHFPHVSRSIAFKQATDQIIWDENPELVEAWKAGRTGFPIVDAAMRQLATTGWMHNRLRMIAAMFFTKDLFQNWRVGEKHFMLNLIDGDLAQNNGGWQWSASTGTDAAPYFRIFNPASQSERCDPEGRYIRQYVPELADIPSQYIHDPEQLPLLLKHTIDYPAPIIDRTKTKDRVMQAFRAIGVVVTE
jgi:deoxyribodipyrimidine photo-lyase